VPRLHPNIAPGKAKNLAEVTAARPPTAVPTWEDSNFHIPISKNAFEMSAEFPLFWPKTRLGDFCSCKLWK
jgi:hypothetical protein